MLLRSSSTPVLGSLIPPVTHSEPVKELEFDVHSPIHPYNSRQLAFPGVGYSSYSGLASAATSHQTDDVCSLDGGDWNFDGDFVPWPSFRRVQSEGDLQSLGRTSSFSASFTAAGSLLSSGKNGKSNDGNDGENPSTGRRQRSRRASLVRHSSLSVITSGGSGSSFGSEIDFALAGVLEASASEEQATERALEPDAVSVYTVNECESSMGAMRLSEPNGGFVNPQVDHMMSARSGEPRRLLSKELVRPLIDESMVCKYLEESFSLETAEHDDISATHKVGDFQDAGTVTASGARRQEHDKVMVQDEGMAVGANGVAVVCNSRGCRPVSESDLGPMFIGGSSGIGGGGGSRTPGGGGGSGSGAGWGDGFGTDSYYRRMLEVDPGHPLLLRNYARFLHEVQHDSPRAEEYYERAILASPGDGEVLAQYAKLLWDVHRDLDRAGSYFERALQASPDDCFVLAAYASFLWASESSEEPQEEKEHSNTHHHTMAPMYGAASTAA